MVDLPIPAITHLSLTARIHPPLLFLFYSLSMPAMRPPRRIWLGFWTECDADFGKQLKGKLEEEGLEYESVA